MPVVETPNLSVTAYGENYRRPELLGAGGDEVIARPVDFVALHAAMTRVYLSASPPEPRVRDPPVMTVCVR